MPTGTAAAGAAGEAAETVDAAARCQRRRQRADHAIVLVCLVVKLSRLQLIPDRHISSHLLFRTRSSAVVEKPRDVSCH